MDLLNQIRADLNKGFSKSDLERLIGLPKNTLTEILKGNRRLSKKSVLKVEKFMTSEKPDPFNLPIIKNTKQVNMEIKEPFTEVKVPIKEEKSTMPDPKDKVAYLKWLRKN